MYDCQKQAKLGYIFGNSYIVDKTTEKEIIT